MEKPEQYIDKKAPSKEFSSKNLTSEKLHPLEIKKNNFQSWLAFAPIDRKWTIYLSLAAGKRINCLANSWHEFSIWFGTKIVFPQQAHLKKIG